MYRIIMLSLMPGINPAYAEIAESKAVGFVKNAPCMPGVSIEQALNDKINLRSQRDLGWQVFKENELYEVERAFLINKSMQLRFRWRLNPDGGIAPVGARAESLCGGQSN